MTEKRTGKISVQTADIFPIIKKWLYSEHNIFLRELISNATDAITKRESEARGTNNEIPKGQINVILRPKKNTLIIEDNGIGMLEEEIEKYIAQLAFSGAEEFVKKMKEAGKETDIIGRFGLGFYSAFMVADKVEVESLSIKENATPCKWICKGNPEYSFEKSSKKDIGTRITLHMNKESKEFLDEFKVQETLKNFCDFMPYQITLVDAEKKVRPTKEDGTTDDKALEIPAEPSVINETRPLWKQESKDLKDQDYKNFFKHLFPVDSDPLFWIHLKIDHPFTLEGILYFPKLNPMRPFNEKNIRLYSKQVFVSDNVKNIIPEFLSLLKGVIDSSDIPLNVSRSSLQGDPNIKKISNYITKKVAESLKKLFKSNRKRYEEIWPDISLFVKYGHINDSKFGELMLPYILFKGSSGNFLTLDEYKASIPEKYKEKIKDKVLYFEKDKSDHTLREQLKNEKIEAIEIDDHIDPHFMQNLEVASLGKDKTSVKFGSIDSEIHQIFETEGTTGDDIKIKELFEKILVSQKEKDKKDIELQKIKNSVTPAYFRIDEQMKRFQKMSQGMGQTSTFSPKKTLVINPNSSLIQNALRVHKQGHHQNLIGKICHHIEDLALISSEGLQSEEKNLFVQRGQELLSDLLAEISETSPPSTN